MNKIVKNLQRGYTLIEISIGLTVASLVLSGVLMGVQKLIRDLDTSRTIKEVSTAIGVIRATMSNDPEESRITLQNMTDPSINAFYLNNVKDPGKSTAAVVTSLGNNVRLLYFGLVSPDDESAAQPRRFRIALDNVTPDTCFNLLAGLEGLAEAAWVRPQNTLKTGYTQVKTYPDSFSPSTARTACRADSNRSIMFAILVFGS